MSLREETKIFIPSKHLPNIILWLILWLIRKFKVGLLNVFWDIVFIRNTANTFNILDRNLFRALKTILKSPKNNN